MDLDRAYIEPLIDDWMEHLQQTMKKHEQGQEQSVNAIDFAMPFVGRRHAIELESIDKYNAHNELELKDIYLLQEIVPSTIKAAFKIAEYLELEPNVKYMAIQLYNKFMYKHFWEIYKTEIANDPSEAFKVCKKTCNQTKLNLMSCFQLACKMDSHSSALGISQILNILYLIDKESEYTRNMISSSEIKVFKTVGFKIPLYTPLHCIEILLVATGLGETPNVFNISIDLLDMAYLKHDRLYSQFDLYYMHKDVNTEHVAEKLISLKSNVLFLSAAIVYCTMFFLCLDTNTSEEQIIITKLAELSNTTNIDISNMANTLLSIATQE